ncbi:MAG TPA: sigma-70 family RNA polymerase sigma factor [Candidatus Eremiobacteraceae bacterium]|nr:sigma-70 family RNA polymerase sigma factor [Candidatus Eremiobacteraceae bacterium]
MITALASPVASLQDLAERYTRTRASADRDAVCEAAMPLVRKIAGCVLRRLPHYFTIDDLIGDGSVGLIRAADRYNPVLGSSFEHWAGRIVRGAIFNGLRRMDFVPERVRRDARTLEATRWKIAQRHGNAPSDDEAAKCAGLDEKKLEAVRVALRRSAPHSLDMPAPNTDDSQPLRDKLASLDADPSAHVELLALCAAVGRAVAALPARERLIVTAFYARNISLRQIGDRLGISKQRVSQLHGRALLGLRAALAPFAESV